MKDLKLYYKPTCPYSRKVLYFLDRRGIKVDRRDINDPENLATLVEVGGKEQYPCLFIDGKPLYESSDIISFLKEEFDK